MNIGILGLFSNDLNGINGAFLYSISHGLISGGLFLLVGALYDRYGTRNIKYYRGMVLIMPIYVVLFLLFSLSNISFPLSLSFIAEILILFSTITVSPFVTIIVLISSILLPIYFIWTFQRLGFGSFSNYLPTLYQDINIKEFHLVFPLLAFSTFLGIYPKFL